jgi:hypothetical protein
MFGAGAHSTYWRTRVRRPRAGADAADLAAGVLVPARPPLTVRAISATSAGFSCAATHRIWLDRPLRRSRSSSLAEPPRCSPCGSSSLALVVSPRPPVSSRAVGVRFVAFGKSRLDSVHALGCVRRSARARTDQAVRAVSATVAQSSSRAMSTAWATSISLRAGARAGSWSCGT